MVKFTQAFAIPGNVFIYAAERLVTLAERLVTLAERLVIREVKVDPSIVAVFGTEVFKLKPPAALKVTAARPLPVFPTN